MGLAPGQGALSPTGISEPPRCPAREGALPLPYTFIDTATASYVAVRYCVGTDFHFRAEDGFPSGGGASLPTPGRPGTAPGAPAVDLGSRGGDGGPPGTTLTARLAPITAALLLLVAEAASAHESSRWSVDPSVPSWATAPGGRVELGFRRTWDWRLFWGCGRYGQTERVSTMHGLVLGFRGVGRRGAAQFVGGIDFSASLGASCVGNAEGGFPAAALGTWRGTVGLQINTRGGVSGLLELKVGAGLVDFYGSLAPDVAVGWGVQGPMRSKARWVRVWFEVSMGLQSIVLYATASYGVTFAFARRADVP